MYLCGVRGNVRDRTIYLTVIDLGSGVGAATRLSAPTTKIRFWLRAGHDTFLRTRVREEEDGNTDIQGDTQDDEERWRQTDREGRSPGSILAPEMGIRSF